MNILPIAFPICLPFANTCNLDKGLLYRQLSLRSQVTNLVQTVWNSASFYLSSYRLFHSERTGPSAANEIRHALDNSKKEIFINRANLDEIAQNFLKYSPNQFEAVLHLYVIANALLYAQEKGLSNLGFEREKQALRLAFQGELHLELFNNCLPFQKPPFKLFPQSEVVAKAIFQQVFDKQLDFPEMICGTLKQSPHLLFCLIENWGEELFDYFSNRETFFQILLQVEGFSLLYLIEFVLDHPGFASTFSEGLVATLITQAAKELQNMPQPVKERLAIALINTLQELSKAPVVYISLEKALKKSEFISSLTALNSSKEISRSTKKLIDDFIANHSSLSS